MHILRTGQQQVNLLPYTNINIIYYSIVVVKHYLYVLTYEAGLRIVPVIPPQLCFIIFVHCIKRPDRLISSLPSR